MKFDLNELDRYDGAKFRRLNDGIADAPLFVVLPQTLWERMGRPVSIEVGIEAPAQGWFTELSGDNDPTIFAGDEPVLSRSAIPGHWDELVARLGLAP